MKDYVQDTAQEYTPEQWRWIIKRSGELAKHGIDLRYAVQMAEKEADDMISRGDL